MCGIVGAVAERNITAILIEGLKRLEYRGYDSAGLAVLTQNGELQRRRRIGKVSELEVAVADDPLAGQLGIAHTRWATHGAPTEGNAHPHFSGNDVAVVHNGIIENHEELREELKGLGYVFTSQTDTEVIVHLIHHTLKSIPDLTDALKAAVKRLHGAYGLALISAKQPDRLVAARSGSPLVIGLGLGENFLASDQLALRQVTDRFMYLEEGDIAEIRRDQVSIWDQQGNKVQRETVQYHEGAEAADKLQAEIQELEKEYTDANNKLARKYYESNKDNVIGALAFSQLQFDSDEDFISAYEGASSVVKEDKNLKNQYDSMKLALETSEGKPYKGDFVIDDGEGTTVKLSDYMEAGKYLLVDFWASWCGPCRQAMPHLAGIVKDHSKTITVLSVGVWEKSKENNDSARKELGITWNTAFDKESRSTKEYGILGIPTLMLVNPEGTIVYRGHSPQDLDAKIKELGL